MNISLRPRLAAHTTPRRSHQSLQPACNECNEPNVRGIESSTRGGADGMGWDGMGWDGMGWDGMGWDGRGWDGMGWDGMGWDGNGAFLGRRRLEL
jgi:hypothetical protein